jgi:hypothetical protein
MTLKAGCWNLEEELGEKLLRSNKRGKRCLGKEFPKLKE